MKASDYKLPCRRIDSSTLIDFAKRIATTPELISKYPHFKDILFRASSMSKSAGIARSINGSVFGHHTILLSYPIFVRNQDWNQALDTILHELAHTVVPHDGHGYHWQEVAVSIGCSGDVYHEMETGPGMSVKLSNPVNQADTPELDSVDLSRIPDTLLSPLSQATGDLLKGPAFTTDRSAILVYMNNDASRFVVKCVVRDLENPEEHSHIKEWGVAAWLKSIPGSRADDNSDAVSLPATDTTAIILRHTIPDGVIVFKSHLSNEIESESKLTFEFLLKRFFLQTQRSKTIAKYLALGEVPEDPDHWVEKEDLPMAGYQKAAIISGIGVEAQGLFMDRGTGKTATFIQQMCTEARSRKTKGLKGMMRVLIVCPPQVRLNWANELSRFATIEGKVQVVRGGQLERIQSLIRALTIEENCAFTVAIIGYDSLVPSVDEFCKVPWDLVCLDESHFIKDSRTNRAKALMKIRDNSSRRRILTGTPIGNTPFDLWQQLEFLGKGLSGFADLKEFRKFHGDWENVEGAPNGVSRLVALKNIPLLQERLSRFTVQITKDQAGLDLPEKVYETIEVEMTSKQKELYLALATKFAAEIKDTMSGTVTAITINNILTKLLRLAQVTSGFSKADSVYDIDDNLIQAGEIFNIDSVNPKIEAAVELIQNHEDPKCKTIIWAHWVQDIENLTNALTEAGIKCGAYYGKTSEKRREELVQAFNNDDDFKVLIANAQTAGEGLNLLGYNPEMPEASDCYAGQVIFFSQGWSSILRGQAEDRAHRRGTREQVRYIDLVVPSTIDEEIRKRVQFKQQMAASTLDVKAILGNLLQAI